MTMHRRFWTLLLVLFSKIACSSGTPFLNVAESARGGWDWYRSCLDASPLFTKACTTSVIMTVSDTVCQRLERRMEKESKRSQDGLRIPQDWRRTFEAGVTGATWSGPVGHMWHGVLDTIVVQNRVAGLILRILLDAVVFSPVGMAGYLACRTMLEGKGLDGVAVKLRARWFMSLLASWKFWPLANILNFWFVPAPYRVLYNNMLGLFWTGLLSHTNSKRVETKRK